MRGIRRGTELFLLACAVLLVPAGAALGADLYLSGALSVSGGSLDAGGGGDVGEGDFEFSNSGDDTDTSPVIGGVFGYAVPLDEMVPYDWDWPLPRWQLRFELEGMFLRDYEFVTTLVGSENYLTEGQSLTLLHNWWLDVPLHAPLSWAFGRIPMLEPVSMHFGAGVGMGMTEFKTTSAAFKGSHDAIHLTWQVGAGFDYQLTDRVSIGMGYRYVDLGSFDYGLRLLLGTTPVGNFTADLASHELRTGLRVNFYSVSSPGSWKRPRFGSGR